MTRKETPDKLDILFRETNTVQSQRFKYLIFLLSFKSNRDSDIQMRLLKLMLVIP